MRLIWMDDFLRFNQANWSHNLVNSNSSEAQTYIKGAVSTLASKLIIKVSKTGQNSYTSGRIITDYKQYFQYGRLVIRAKMPQGGKGIWPAIWLMGKNEHEVGWPRCGEIDIVEFFGGFQGTGDNLAVSTLHHGDKNDIASNCWKQIPNPSTAYHNYQMDWSEGSISFSIDGQKYCTKDISNIDSFHQPFYLLVNVAVGTWLGYPTPDVQFPQYLFIDSIKYYR